MWLILCCLQLPVPVPSFLGWVPLVHGIGRDTGDVGLSWEPVELIIVGGGTACLPPDDLYSHLLIEIGCPEGFFFLTLHKVL